MTPRSALTIAGSDSGGCAGVQADLKTFAAHRVHGTCALSAVTAQHTMGVIGIVAVEPSFVVAQVETVCADLPPVATKTGMLAIPETVAAVAHLAARGLLPHLVVDPVLVSTSGHSLMAGGGVAAYRDLLLPRATVVTPNLPEAALLTGRDLSDLTTVRAMADAAEELRVLGATFVVVKGGHLVRRRTGAAVPDAAPDGTPPPGTGRAIPGTEPTGCPDVVAGPEGTLVLQGTSVDTANDHGTGCTFSAAVAAGLALGATPLQAITDAKAYVQRALLGARRWRLGTGHGPVDHFGWTPTGAPPGPAPLAPMDVP